MASIILGPGEEFEHRHESDSETILRRGTRVRISIGGRSPQDMEPNKPIRIPGGMPHRMRNDGPDYSIVDCHHGLTGNP